MGLLLLPHPAASSSLDVPMQRVWGFGDLGDLRSASMPPTCGLNSLVKAFPLLSPCPAAPRPGSGLMETRRTDRLLLLSLLLSQPTTPQR